MENKSEMLMLGGVMAFCADCDDQRIFAPVEDGADAAGWGRDNGEFCCTTCDAAVFLLEVLDNTGTSRRRAA